MGHDSRRRWAPLLLLAALVACLGLSAWLGTQAMGQGWVAGPSFRLRLGDYHLIAQTTIHPECLPLTQTECFLGFPNSPGSTPLVYAIWAGRISALPAVGFRSRVTVSAGRHLLRLPILSRETALRP